MDTSKTRSIKSLLLQAWQEKWSDISWGIHIKSVLPRGVSGDVYDLADCILQQALVGPEPNNLFMSYLMHSLSSRIVSYGAVLSSIGRYQHFYKPYCILRLLDLLKTFQSRIGCHGNDEECIALCKAVVSVTHWLYSCTLYCISKLAELEQNPEHISMMAKSFEALFHFNNSTFIKSLLYVGKFEDQDMYTQMLQKHKELEIRSIEISEITKDTISRETMEGALSLVDSVNNLPMVPSEQVPKNNQRLQILASTINIMVSIDLILNPANDVTAFVNQLLVVKKLQSFTLPQLYCEIIRASFIGIIDASGSSEDLKWFASIFLKVRQLISEIHSIHVESEEDALEKGLDILLQYSPLLDLTDLKSNFDCLQYLTNEFCKMGILTEAQMCKLITRRHSESFKHANPKQNHQGASGDVYYTESSNLLIGIINKMMYDHQPPPQTKAKLAPIIPHGLMVRTPLGKILDEIFNSVHSRGWLNLESIHYFDTFLCVGGARWLCEALVKRILNYQFIKDINRAVDMILGIFYLDIEKCTVALLHHVLPFYLFSETHQEQLAEPYGTALSRLAVIATYVALQSTQHSSGAGSKTKCKRSHREVNIDDIRDPNEHSRPSKMPRSSAQPLEGTSFELQSLSDDHICNAVDNPINKAIADFMRTLLVIASDATISARSHFPIRFLEQIVLCAKDQAPAMLQFTPLELVGLLLKKFPEEFSHELTLAVSSMQSSRARKVAALSLCHLTIAQNKLTCKNQ